MDGDEGEHEKRRYKDAPARKNEKTMKICIIINYYSNLKNIILNIQGVIHFRCMEYIFMDTGTTF